MKKQGLILLLCLISFYSFSQSKKVKEIENLALSWAEANNNHNLDKLEGMYSSSVQFYGKTKSITACLKDKEDFFKKFDYFLSISDIEVDFYKNGVIKCNFNKQEGWKGVDRNDQAYLLFEKRGSGYLITGESDGRMDNKLGVDLRLGEKEYKKSYSIIFVFGGAMIVGVIAVFMTMRRRKSTKAILNKKRDKNPNPIIYETPSNHEKGKKFEKYIVNLFDGKSGRFEIKYWSNDIKAENGLYAVSNRNPDIEFRFNDFSGHSKFAIECKWRAKFDMNENSTSGIYWAEAYQIKNYIVYQEQEKIPVWVAIGVKGTPERPEQLYLAPLSHICDYPFVFESYLQQFRRNASHRFFFNPQTGALI